MTSDARNSNGMVKTGKKGIQPTARNTLIVMWRMSQHYLPKGSIYARLRHQLPSHTGRGRSVRWTVLH